MQNFKKIIVVGALIYKKSQMLACKRSQEKDQAGLWEVPGGKVEKDESHQEALERELKEELQISVVVQHHVATSFVTNPISNIHITMYVYACQIIGSTETNDLRSTDHDEIRWIDTQDIAQLQWAIADVPILDDFQQFLEKQAQCWDNPLN